ncbi:hypothetical protein [Georhizobium profundi]|nr:hypothetical protein [Georhizobium profundi]
MSVFEYMAALDGFIKATGQADKALSDREKDELWEWVQDEP